MTSSLQTSTLLFANDVNKLARWTNRLAVGVRVLFIAALLASAQAARGAVIAHWSFDTGTITTDGSGNVLTAADETGTHNATGVRNGTATSASVSGPFGNALQLNNTSGAQTANNAYMSFPNLTELMGSTGVSFTVSAWIKTVNTADNNTIIGDWGNAPSGDRFIYWFSIANSSSQGQPRAQARAQNVPANDDIFARQVVTNVANGAWRHVAWTFNKTTATLKTYVDGGLVDTLASIAPPLHITNSASAIGVIGRKADNNRHFVGAVDEIWVLGEVLDDAAVQTLFTANAVPGATNPPVITQAPLSFSVYEGDNTNLTVGVSGTPPFTYTWYFNDTILADATNATLTLAT
jgi:hypothetical protein